MEAGKREGNLKKRDKGMKGTREKEGERRGTRKRQTCVSHRAKWLVVGNIGSESSYFVGSSSK